MILKDQMSTSKDRRIKLLVLIPHVSILSSVNPSFKTEELRA